MKVNFDQIAKADWGSGAMWEFENGGGELLQMTRNFATKRATYEVIGYDEDAQDWVIVEVISKAEAEKYWTIPGELYTL